MSLIWLEHLHCHAGNVKALDALDNWRRSLAIAFHLGLVVTFCDREQRETRFGKRKQAIEK